MFGLVLLWRWAYVGAYIKRRNVRGRVTRDIGVQVRPPYVVVASVPSAVPVEGAVVWPRGHPRVAGGPEGHPPTYEEALRQGATRRRE